MEFGLYDVTYRASIASRGKNRDMDEYDVVYLYRPLLRVTDKLLAIGLLTDKDLDQLLCLIDPANFDNGYYSGTHSPCLPLMALYNSLRQCT